MIEVRIRIFSCDEFFVCFEERVVFVGLINIVVDVFVDL